jgi:hypothetical protein
LYREEILSRRLSEQPALPWFDISNWIDRPIFSRPEMALGLMRPLIATSPVASRPSIEKLLISV